MDPPRHRPVPVTLLGGFLGTGKTTLLNRILSGPHGQRIAVLINDFGELAIDAELVVQRTATTIALANGCVCCTIQDDLLAAVRALLLLPEPPDRIVIELSGLSDPNAVLGTLALMQRQWPLNLDGVIALVDAENFPPPEHPDHVLVRQQLALADVVVLNKVDLVTASAWQAHAQRIREWVPSARLVPAAFAEVPLELVLGQFEPRAGAEPVRAVAPHGFQSFSYVSPHALKLVRLRELITELPVAIFRAKGIVRLDARPDHKTIVQVVGRRARIDLGPAWGSETKGTRLVFLAAGSEIDPTDVQRRFDACRQGLLERGLDVLLRRHGR